jgi:hypothetical protein
MRRHSKGTVAALVGVWIITGLLSGCSSPAKSVGMTPASLGIEKTHPYSVKIEVGGGRATNALTDPSQISNEAFAQAIADAIVHNRLFSEIARGQPGDYLLRVEILSLEQPLFGLNMTVRLEAAWELINTQTGKPVLREAIVSSHTATPGDAFAAVTRIRLATEGAAKKNIEQGLLKIGQLAL